ncbi:phosphatidate cytidylyltransferase [Methylobacterium durans]|uniref:phosphatidate cytidylyltransferase n=1 Tax=Methylobacterium durans TaxID=2202825 RepID=UPI002AFEABD8|nr:phosphatidate cytidylyltransferase [Methylobacterium durans]MEA1833025.1 phosphatidate cytidylyltransferase [Methylobacterium durans]
MSASGEVSPGPVPGRARLGGRELLLRIVSGVILAGIVVAALVEGGWPFALVWLVAGIVGAAEWIGMSRTRPGGFLILLIGATLGGLALCAQSGTSPLAALAVFVSGAAAVLVVAGGGWGRLRAVAGLAAAAVIVLVPSALRDDPEIGIVGPAWMFAVVWSTDIAAYFTGRTLGGPKLMPRISPKKTWSGAIGGLLAAVAAGTGLMALARVYGWSSLAEAPLEQVALASAVASILSQAGDLVESGLKRVYGVKDSGRSIPGHGGVMDRLDGFFAVAILVGVYLVLRHLAAA